MKNLYIYTMYEDGELIREVWKDVKVTRDKKQIVTKRDATYRLSHGSYKFEQFLDKVRVNATGFPEPVVSKTEYISFTLEEITEDVKEILKQPFIERYTKEQEELRKKIEELELIKNRL